MNKTSYKVILKNKEYCKNLSASLINRFGDSIDAIAASWIVYEISGYAAMSAIIFALLWLPSVLVSPLAGPWVERHCKKAIMIVTDIIRAVCVGFIATGLWIGFATPMLIAITSLIISTAEAFRLPAGSAIVPKLVEKEHYDHAVSLSEAASQVVTLVGTGVAAFIIATIGSSGAIYLDMATFLISALIISTLHINGDTADKSSKFDFTAYKKDLSEGFKYCISNKRIFTIAICALFINGILVPFNSLQTPIVKEIFNGDEAFLSVIGITVTLSMLLGSSLYPFIKNKLHDKMVMILPVLGISIFYFGANILTPLYVNKYASMLTLITLCFILGLSAVLCNVYVGSELMKAIDPSYMSRVSSITSAMCTAIMPVTSFAVSIIVSLTSVRVILFISGIIAIIFIAFLAGSRAFATVPVAEEPAASPKAQPTAEKTA